jgi:hypothetical protein
MMVIGAGGIERGAAVRATGIAMEVFVNGQFPFAGAAQNCLKVKLVARPDCDRMIRQGEVAILAGVIGFAAAHLDGDNVDWRVVVSAAGLGIEIEATNFY